MQNLLTSSEKISVDFSTCLESYPCQHKVTTYSFNGETKSRLMRGPDICNLVVSKNLDVDYSDFAHFSYCFSSQHHDYLAKLKEKKAKQGQQIIVRDDSEFMHNEFHDIPQITMAQSVVRKASTHKIKFIKMKKSGTNVFTIDYENLTANTPGYLFGLHGFSCVKNNQVVWPHLIKINCANTDLNIYSKCVKNSINKTVNMHNNKWGGINFTHEFDYNILFFKDVTFTIEDSTGIPDEIYAIIHTDTVHWERYKCNNGCLNVSVVTSTYDFFGKLDIFNTELKSDGYYNRLYLWSENLDKVIGITISIGKFTICDDVSPQVLARTDKLVEIMLGHLDYGQILSGDNLLVITYRTINNFPVEIEVYGKKQLLISYK